MAFPLAAYLSAQSREFATQMVQLTKQAHQEAGTEFNVDSPKQLQQILFEKLQIPVKTKTPSGQPSRSPLRPATR